MICNGVIMRATQKETLHIKSIAVIHVCTLQTTFNHYLCCSLLQTLISLKPCHIFFIQMLMNVKIILDYVARMLNVSILLGVSLVSVTKVALCGKKECAQVQKINERTLLP